MFTGVKLKLLSIMENKIIMKGIDLVGPVKPGNAAFKNVIFNPNAQLVFPLFNDKDVAGAGQPVTLRAACAMIDQFFSALIEEIENEPDISKEKKKEEILNRGFAAVFGKETIMRLLLQKGCEGIRIYSCKDDLGKNSLLLSAVDENWNDLAVVNYTKGLKYITDIIMLILTEKVSEIANSTIELDEKHGPDGYTLEDYVINRFNKENLNDFADSIRSVIKEKSEGKTSLI